MIQTGDNNLRTALAHTVFSPNPALLAAQRAPGGGYTFSAVQPTLLNRIKSACGFGEVAPKRVAQALLANQATLMSLADEWIQEKAMSDVQGHEEERVVLADRYITQLFGDAKMGGQAIDLFEGRYTHWMQDLPNDLKERKITQITLPSTHDSGAYTLDWRNPIDTTWQAKAISMVCRTIPFVRNIVASWTITQEKSVAGQLNDGMRFFDLRVSYDETNGQFYLSHMFACEPLEVTLTAIRDFIQEHPEEAIVLTMKPNYDHRATFYPQIGAFKEAFTSALGSSLSPPTQNGAMPTLNEMVSKRQNVLAMWNDDHSLNTSLIWGPDAYAGHWCNSSDLQTNVTYLKDLLENVPTDGSSFYDFSITMTPQPRDIEISVLQRLFAFWKTPRSLATLTSAIQNASQQFFTDPAYREKLKHVSVIPTDLPYHAFVHQVVQLNYS